MNCETSIPTHIGLVTIGAVVFWVLWKFAEWIVSQMDKKHAEDYKKVIAKDEVNNLKKYCNSLEQNINHHADLILALEKQVGAWHKVIEGLAKRVNYLELPDSIRNASSLNNVLRTSGTGSMWVSDSTTGKKPRGKKK